MPRLQNRSHSHSLNHKQLLTLWHLCQTLMPRGLKSQSTSQDLKLRVTTMLTNRELSSTTLKSQGLLQKRASTRMKKRRILMTPKKLSWNQSPTRHQSSNSWAMCRLRTRLVSENTPRSTRTRRSMRRRFWRRRLR